MRTMEDYKQAAIVLMDRLTDGGLLTEGQRNMDTLDMSIAVMVLHGDPEVFAAKYLDADQQDEFNEQYAIMKEYLERYCNDPHWTEHLQYEYDWSVM